MVEAPEAGSRRRRASLPQSPPPVLPQIVVETSVSMSHEGDPANMTENEKSFRKTFFDMIQMVKSLFEERNTRLQGECLKLPKGEGSS